MKVNTLRLSRPLYEGLPWLYLSLGLFALIVSYGQSSSLLSLLVGLPGFMALMAGIVVLLKRRDYRAMRAHYERPDALSEPTREEL
jgi:hypothetical protein